jgi:hypothetical protein
MEPKDKVQQEEIKKIKKGNVRFNKVFKMSDGVKECKECGFK